MSSLLEANVESLLDTAFAGTDGDLLVVDPAAETIVSLVEAAVGRDDLPRMSMLVDEAVVKEVMDDFLVASKAADLVADDALAIGVLAEEVDNALFVSESRAVAPVSTRERTAALSTTDEEFVSEVYETYQEASEAAEEYGLRTPAISRVTETLAAEIGTGVRDDFEAVLDALDAASGTEGLDEVTVALLVAARNDVLLYDISKWGEDVGIASKATFSRTKTRLEDLGLIDTEKVPIDVGRPRLRLKLGDDRLVGLDAEAFADVAVDLLG